MSTRNETLNRLEHLALYGVITDGYHRQDDGKYAVTLANGFPKAMTAAEVKLFASGAINALSALADGHIQVKDGQFYAASKQVGGAVSLSSLVALNRPVVYPSVDR